MTSWLDEELSECVFKDKRLTDRFKTIVTQLSQGNGKSIPDVCEEWSMAKASYRFLSNERVDESEILSGHFAQTAKRINACQDPILILHDTTEFSYKRKNPEEIGLIQKTPCLNPHTQNAIDKAYKVCGILMHASLAITPEGLPLGLRSNQFWTRKVFKNTNQMKREINQTRVPISEKESIRWLEGRQKSNLSASTDPARLVHIGDRENDIYEYLSDCDASGSYFIVRSCVNRLANETTIAEEVALESKAYRHDIDFVDADGHAVHACLDIKVKRLTLHPPVDKQHDYEDLNIAVVSATERNPPTDRQRIKWVFLTNLPVTTKEQAITVLDWYKQRWKIEIYFKILKSGLKAEQSKLRTADRLAKLISIYCILAWRIQWITMLNREGSALSPQLAFDDCERTILEKRFKKMIKPKTLQDYIVRLAKLGGYLNRAADSPPGNTVIWRGLNKLYELRAGFEMAICG